MLASLAVYKNKRDFKKTPEPSGQKMKPRNPGPIFVIQKHDASSLHYDFRLEIEGVLKSWSVPKGPSINPSDKRLAVQTEDHPIEYANFEGNIPKDAYGGGSVIIWDRGTFDNRSTYKSNETIPIETAYKSGVINIDLDGEKIKGGYALIRMKGRDKLWLLIKETDRYADRRRKPTSSQPESIVSGKTNTQLAKEQSGSR